MRRALPFLFLLFLLVISGCGEKRAALERRPTHYRHVISLSPSTTEIIASNADGQILVGRTAACNYPPNLVNSIRIVASTKPDYEAIASIKPDLIVYDKSLYNDQDIAKLKSTGADLFSFDATNMDDYIKSFYLLGSKLASETRFEEYIGRVRDEIAQAKASLPSPSPKVAILMPSPSGDDYICGTDSFLGDVVKITGGQLVGPKGDKFVALNAESFVSMNPDVIVVGGSKTDTSGPGLVLADARFKTINAVKQNRVLAINADVLFRKGGRVDQLVKAMHNVMTAGAK